MLLCVAKCLEQDISNQEEQNEIKLKPSVSCLFVTVSSFSENPAQPDFSPTLNPETGMVQRNVQAVSAVSVCQFVWVCLE